MDELSRDLEKAELDANRIFSQRGKECHESHPRRSNSISSSRSLPDRECSPQTEYRDINRIETQNDLERHQTAVSRIATHRSQHSATVGASVKSRASRKPLPAFGAGKPYPPPLPEKETYVVEFDGPDDPLHPQNWSFKRKMITSSMLTYTTLISTFTSAVFSAATVDVADIFGVSTEVSLLGLSLYVLGYAFGPIIWAPLSELRGRRLPIIVSSFGFTVFQFGVAAAKDLQTIMLCRFFGGFFGAAPLAVVGAIFADIFNNQSRGPAITAFAMTVFIGPLLAPFIGGFIVDSYLGWRWTEYLSGILGASAFILDLFFLAETYPPVVLIEKAEELRRRTRNWGIHAKQEEIEIDFQELVQKNFSRPIMLLITEPIALLLSIYMAFIYGLLYLFMTAYPIVFQQIHGFNRGIGGLPYFGMVAGQLLAGAFIISQQPWYTRKLRANNDVPVPEWRLPPAIVGAFAFAGGLFWFGWSGYTASIHWIVPTLSGLLTGFGLLSIFLQSLNYIIDTYLLFAASAIAANSLLRSLAGAGFPLFSQYMFRRLGVNWSGTLLGCLAAVMIPIPILFYLYGHRLREMSKFAPTFAAPPDEFLEEDGVVT